MPMVRSLAAAAWLNAQSGNRLQMATAEDLLTSPVPEYTIIEKTGHEDETQALFEQLQQFKVRQFTRSGRVAVTKLKKELLSDYLKEVDRRSA